MKLSTTLSAFTLASYASASPHALTKRQSSTPWEYACATSLAPPSAFKAFALENCTAQLAFTKDRYIAIQWAFEATYPDGSTALHTPFRDFNTFGVSDTFYPWLGNNFLDRWPGKSAFTAVHEFGNVCNEEGVQPVRWRFYTTSANEACSARDYWFTSPAIEAVSGEGVIRPAKVTGVTLRRANDAGEFQVRWDPVPGAAAYSVIVEYPSGTDEVGNPYLNVRGARVVGTTTTVPTSKRRQDVPRKVIVHAVNDQGLWSLTSDVKPVVAGW